MNYLADLGHRFGGASPSAPRPERLEAGWPVLQKDQEIKSSASEPRCGGWHAIEAHENDLKQRFLVPDSSRSGDDSKTPMQTNISTAPLSSSVKEGLQSIRTVHLLGTWPSLALDAGVKCMWGGSLTWCCICFRGEHSRLGEQDPSRIAHRTATFAVCKESLAPQEKTRIHASSSTPFHVSTPRHSQELAKRLCSRCQGSDQKPCALCLRHRGIWCTAGNHYAGFWDAHSGGLATNEEGMARASLGP